MLSLLIRLAEPLAGRILVSNRDISELPLRELLRLITLVPQDPWLHTGTIAENIGYGRTGAARNQIIAAVDRASVTTFTSKLANGYDTPVGEHGQLLSGGQRRRIAVARALVRDTPILLLDEPTAGLDLATESRLIADMLTSTAGKTVLLVTHQARLANLASHVIRLEGGRTESVQPACRGHADQLTPA